jgi:hypothetical protein
VIGSWRWRFAQAIAGLCAGACGHAQPVIHIDASLPDKLKSNIGVGVQQGGASVRAEMTLLDERGSTRVLPRVSSAWSASRGIDVSTVLSYSDWNQTIELLRPTLDSKLVFRPSVAYLSGIEASVRRANGTSTESLQLTFSDLDTGWRVLGGDPLAIKTNFTMRSQGAEPELGSRITSGLGIGRGLAVLTTLQLTDGGSTVAPQSAIDTKLVYRSPIPFINRFEGDLRRSALGETRQSVSILFPDVSSRPAIGPSFKLSTAATLAERTTPSGLETRMVGLETKFSGAMLPVVGGRNALSLRMEHSLDEHQRQRSTLAYDHAWMPAETTSVGFNLKLLKTLEQLETMMDVTWKAQF